MRSLLFIRLRPVGAMLRPGHQHLLTGPQAIRPEFLTQSRIVVTTCIMHCPCTELLRNHGLQVTAQRVAILESVSEHPHCTADTVESDVRHRIGSISHQTVYDGLSALVEHGLLRRIQPARSPARFETRTEDNHHHLICRSCGRMIDVDCRRGYAPCLEPTDTAGFDIDEAEVIYWGHCPKCRRTNNT